MTKTVAVEISLLDDGAIVETANGSFSGGVPAPDLSSLALEVWDENATLPSATFEGHLQLSVTGSSDAYRELARYFLALSELDTQADPNYHDHLDDLVR